MELIGLKVTSGFIGFSIIVAISIGSSIGVSISIAADLEVIESFWTSTEHTSDPQRLMCPKIEADRADGRAKFAVTFANRSRQDLTSIRATTSLPIGVKDSTNGNSIAKAIYPGVIRAGDSFTVQYPVEFDATFEDRSYRLNIQIEFSQVQQNKRFNESHEANFRLTGRCNLQVEAFGAVEPGLSSQAVFKVTNRGTAKANGVRISLPGLNIGSPTSPQTSIAIVGQRSIDTAALEPGQSIELPSSLFASRTAAGSVQAIPVTLHYQNACNELISSVTSVGVSVYPEQHRGKLDLLPDTNFLTAQAGKVSELKFNLVNHSLHGIKGISVTVSPTLSSASTSESLKIMGQQRWMIPDVEPAASHSIPLKVFTSRELIGRATAVHFSVQYELLGQPHSQAFDHSLYVDGEVNIQLRDAAITLIGGVPNFTGSLLNEGAGTAQFSSIEIVDCDGWNSKKSSALYLGEIAENSPLPISIPLDQSSDVAAGNYEFRLQLNYKNSLKELQRTEFLAKVRYAPELKANNSDSEVGSTPQLPHYLGWLIGGIAIGFIIGMMIFRRSRNHEFLRMIQQSKLEGLTSLDQALEKTSTRDRG